MDDLTTHPAGFYSGLNNLSFDDDEVTSILEVDDDKSLEDCDTNNQKGEDCDVDKQKRDNGEQKDQVIDEGNQLVVPEVNMKFNSIEEMYDLYLKYAYAVGFPVRKRNSKKGPDGQVRYVSFCCSREGKNHQSGKNTNLKPQPTTQVGCKARITTCSDIRGIWRISRVLLEHNHDTSPTKSRVFLCNRILDEKTKRKIEMDDIAGISTHKSYISSMIQEGGYEKMTAVEKDFRNHVEKARRLRLGEGDAAAIQAYFQRMQNSWVLLSNGFR